MSKKRDKSAFNKQTLKSLRLIAGFSQTQLAVVLEVVARSVSNWENENNPVVPSDVNLSKIAKALNCKIDDLFYEFDFEFKTEATETIQAMFFRCAESTDPREMRIAVSIYSHLFPEPMRHDFNLTVNDAEQSNADLLDEGDVPACEVD